MKHVGLLALVSFSVLVTVACASRSLDTEVTRCVYPDSPRTPAPSFVCGDSVTGFPVFVLRSSEPSDDTVSERMQSVLDSQIVEWTELYSRDWFTQPAQRQRAQAYLSDWLADEARIVRSRVSPNGILWLLVAFPETLSTLETQTRQAITTPSLD